LTVGETDFYTRVHAYELGLLRAALDQHNNHQGKAAEYLGLTYHAFRGLLRKHGLKK
jgi:psp operon transcriptional activator